MKLIAIYDNQGKTLDRYTVVVGEDGGVAGREYDALGCDRGGEDFSQWGRAWYNIGGQNVHLGKHVAFEDLDEVTQYHIADRVFGK